jgi:glycosyltransferase involved in cell wall biosynthesis
MESNITVLVTCYNKAKFITRCLNSIKFQILLPQKIVIIDDASTDNSVSLIQKFINKNEDLNIKFIENKLNLGPAVSRNLALEKINTKYVSFIDADDFWHKGKLLSHFRLMTMNKSDFVYNSYRWIHGNRVTDREVIAPFLKGECTTLKLLEANFVSGSASAVTCSMRNLRKVGFFDTKLQSIARSFGEDWDLWLRLSTISNFNYSLKTLTYLDDSGLYSNAPDNKNILIDRYKAHYYIRSKHINSLKLLDSIFKIQKTEFNQIKSKLNFFDWFDLHFFMLITSYKFYFKYLLSD